MIDNIKTLRGFAVVLEARAKDQLTHSDAFLYHELSEICGAVADKLEAQARAGCTGNRDDGPGTYDPNQGRSKVGRPRRGK